MKVRKVKGRRFAKWESVDIELPEKGLVLVTGRNGHGKSTLVEAVAQGVWNSPLRGGPGWRADGKSGVEIEFDGGVVARSVGKKHSLTWKVDKEGAGSYPTRTKSQTALESVVGTFHVWRHACTFHTEDAGRFSTATDAQRKRLLEEVLELDRVEAAYRKSRDELKAAERELTSCQHAHAMAAQKNRSIAEQRALMVGELENEPDLEALREELTSIKEQREAARLAVEGSRAMFGLRSEAVEKCAIEVQVLKERVSRLTNIGGTCPHCEQRVDEARWDKSLGDAEELLLEAEHALLIAREMMAHQQVALEERQVALIALAKMEAENVQRGREGKALIERNDKRRKRLASIDHEARAAAQEVENARDTMLAAEIRALTLRSASEVLSYQGVRAALLDGAVEALQTLANAWLARLGLADLEIELDSQTEAKSGKVSDKIGMAVHGAGGGYGYVCASTGERRRIDIALLLAIGELAGQARGMSPESTLFADELFDGLDAEGTAAVCDMLREVSAQRCVVVVTHSQELMSALRPDLHLVANDGALGRRK